MHEKNLFGKSMTGKIAWKNNDTKDNDIDFFQGKIRSIFYKNTNCEETGHRATVSSDGDRGHCRGHESTE